MENPQQLECDTPDCTHWNDGLCALPGSVTIQEHHCIDFEERLPLPIATVTIAVKGGSVQAVYASQGLPKMSVEVIDLDDADCSAEEEQHRLKDLLKQTTQDHAHIY